MSNKRQVKPSRIRSDALSWANRNRDAFAAIVRAVHEEGGSDDDVYAVISSPRRQAAVATALVGWSGIFNRTQLEVPDRLQPEYPAWQQFQGLGEDLFQVRINDTDYECLGLANISAAGDMAFSPMSALSQLISQQPVAREHYELIDVHGHETGPEHGHVIEAVLKRIGLRYATFQEGAHVALAIAHGSASRHLPMTFVTKMCFEDEYLMCSHPYFQRDRRAGRWTLGLHRSTRGGFNGPPAILVTNIDRADD